MIRLMTDQDIPEIVKNFAQENWPKPATTFEGFLSEQQQDKRLVWIAHVDAQFAWYVTLNWKSKYKLFCENKIPEIMDLNILPISQLWGWF